MDLIGKTFDRLTVVKNAGTRRGQRLWSCQCSCGSGKEVIASTGRLNIGAVRSCGCIRKERPNSTRHGASTKEGRDYSNPQWRTYVSWQHMRARCDKPKNKDYRYYGGRGITYDPEWVSFEKFLADMGERPEGMSLDRVDNAGNYTKDNCRWATSLDQTRNRNMNSIVIYHDGRSQTIGEWAKELGITAPTIHQRLNRKWPIARVLSAGIHHKSGKFTPT